MFKKLTMKFLAAFAVAIMFSFSLSAQILSDYVEGGTGGATLEQIDSVTQGTTHTYYVEPDPYYSPSYSAASNSGYASTATWSWFKASADNWTSASIAASGSYTATNNNNNLSIVFGTSLGLDSIGVYEGSTLAGLCDGDTSYLKIFVVDTSSVDYAAASMFYDAAVSNDTLKICEGDLLLSSKYVYVDFTESISGNPSLQLDYSFSQVTVNSAGASSTIYSFDSTIANSYTQVKDLDGSDKYLYRPAAGDGYVGLDDYACYTNSGVKQQTIYTYTLEGVSDRISRKADYATGGYTYNKLAWTLYDKNDTDATFVIVVNPAPVTGPIYHISNTWAN